MNSDRQAPWRHGFRLLQRGRPPAYRGLGRPGAGSSWGPLYDEDSGTPEWELDLAYPDAFYDDDDELYYFIKRIEDAMEMQARYAALNDIDEIVEVWVARGSVDVPEPAEGRLHLGYDVVLGDISYVSDLLGWTKGVDRERVLSGPQLLWRHVEAYWLTKVNHHHLFDSFGLAQSFLEFLDAWVGCFPNSIEDPVGYTDIFYLQLVTHGPDGQPVPVLTDFDDGA
jgi:hypothetical protein